MAFVVTRLDHIETRIPAKPPDKIVEQPAEYDLVAGLDAQMRVHAKEIEDIKMAVHKLCASRPVPPLPQPQAQSLPQPKSQPRLPTLSRAIKPVTGGPDMSPIGGGDEAAGVMSPAVSQAMVSMVAKGNDGEFTFCEHPDEHWHVQEGRIRRELCKAFSPAAVARRPVDFGMKKEQTSPLPLPSTWDHPEEAFLKAALDVVDRLVVPVEICSPEPAKQAAGQFSLPSPLLLQTKFSAEM